jgi:hypothetical protein
MSLRRSNNTRHRTRPACLPTAHMHAHI